MRFSADPNSLSPQNNPGAPPPSAASEQQQYNSSALPSSMVPGGPSSRVGPVSYVSLSGQAPLSSDYSGMPCNIQERMSMTTQHTGGPYSMAAVPSLEDTLVNLPYDAISGHHTLPTQSGEWNL